MKGTYKIFKSIYHWRTFPFQIVIGLFKVSSKISINFSKGFDHKPTTDPTKYFVAPKVKYVVVYDLGIENRRKRNHVENEKIC